MNRINLAQKERVVPTRGPHLLIEGNPGTGKSYKLHNELSLHGKAEVLHLTFSRQNRDKAEAHGYQALTFHQLAFKIIRSFSEEAVTDPTAHGLQEECRNLVLEIKPDSQANKPFEKIRKQYDRILPLACRVLANGFHFALSAQVIGIDELQDLSADMVRLLGLVTKQNPRLKLVAAGDRTQCIYFSDPANQKRIQRLFDSFENEFGSVRRIKLTNNHRSNTAIQLAANKLGEATISGYVPYQIARPIEPGAFKFVCCKHQKEFAAKISAILKRCSKQRVAILCSSHYEVSRLEHFRNDPRTVVETIHSYKGSEAETVILANCQGNLTADAHWARVLFVAITRATKTFYFVTSFPSKNILSVFKGAAFEILQDQKQVRARSNGLRLTGEKHLTLENVSRSMIDSLEIAFRFEDLPFIPMEGHRGKEKRSPFRTETVIDLPIRHEIQRGNQQIVFKFHDLSELKGRGMTDFQIVKYVRDLISFYFDRRDFELLRCGRIKRLDLCKISRFHFPRFAQRIMHLLMQVKASNVKKIGSDENHTLYLNAGSKRSNTYDRVVTAYCPGNKEVNALINGQNLLKLEVRWRGGTKSLKNTAGLDMNMGQLLDAAKQAGSLSKLHSQWLKYDLPGPATKRNPKQRIGEEPHSIEDLESTLGADMKTPSRRTRDSLCFALHSLIDEEDRNAWRYLFGE